MACSERCFGQCQTKSECSISIEISRQHSMLTIFDRSLFCTSEPTMWRIVPKKLRTGSRKSLNAFGINCLKSILYYRYASHVSYFNVEYNLFFFFQFFLCRLCYLVDIYRIRCVRKINKSINWFQRNILRSVRINYKQWKSIKALFKPMAQLVITICLIIWI